MKKKNSNSKNGNREITKRLVGATEAAVIGEVSVSTIYNWANTGIIEAAVESAPRERGRPGPLYRAADIRRIKRERGR
jgi:hypothetical protein